MRPTNFNRLNVLRLVVVSFVLGISVGRAEQLPSPVQVAGTTSPAKATPPPDANPRDTDWPQHGNEWREQRFSPLDQVNRENVARLGLA